MVATVHRSQVDGTRPIAGCIYAAGQVIIATDSTLQVDGEGTDGSGLQTTGCRRDRGEMTTRRETAGGNERRVELVFLGLTTYETDYGTYVVNLGRPLGIDAGTVVGTNDGIACIEQGLDNCTEVGHSLSVVVEPGTTIDMNHDGIAFFLLFRQIDVAGMISLAIIRIVNVFPLLRGLQLYFGHLETAETACGLSHTEVRGKN